jgi:hypothetical protein
LKLAVQLNITWPLPEDWDDQALVLLCQIHSRAI